MRQVPGLRRNPPTGGTESHLVKLEALGETRGRDKATEEGWGLLPIGLYPPVPLERTRLKDNN